ncbi:hypothetical protein ACH3XW_26400 [Acanthocheilonema viteae]
MSVGSDERENVMKAVEGGKREKLDDIAKKNGGQSGKTVDGYMRKQLTNRDQTARKPVWQSAPEGIVVWDR